MPPRARAPCGCGGGGEEVKEEMMEEEEDFVDSVLNFAGGGGGDESDGGEQQAAAVTTEYKSKNLVAERRRRERLNGNILALRAAVPKITKASAWLAASSLPPISDYLILTPIMQIKMSKDATLMDAIDHIKNLQSKVLELQHQLADSAGEAWEKQASASCSESFVPTENMNTHYQGQVELISLGPCKYNLKIFWTKRAGLFTKVLEALCSYNVEVLSLNSISLYGHAESFFSIEYSDKVATALSLQVKGEHDAVMVELRNLLSSIVEVPII
ncbi:hypothetical protein GUJ93_ZPchr0007g4542 [Zizania palustris]|uniref:BHLH domain-containing protein n=1 Tax=Zizania palustris TaxID=103762 RepID=A0A8J5W522_ZIZPA|nr:hypothetical protein GUJ93_ZPchr0007g4542 [Zizania palustris]